MPLDTCVACNATGQAVVPSALFRPANFGQRSRISGITPADLAVVMLYVG